MKAMKKQEFAVFLAQVGCLDARQKARLSEVLAALKDSPTPAQVIDEEFSGQVICPSCASGSAHKWGVVSGLQRYRCKRCQRTFNALTGASMAHLRKKELWEHYSRALSESLSLSQAAERCGIDRTYPISKASTQC
jgi:transposase-like protein